ncbi:hypothetical protein [Flavobacterium cyanobacteriorum]|uniref:hypothetical protein n=1 Tax=Flavobacterium cyanobacteriorum TaxID=2022802 RepID=UPI0013FD7D5F|nr:hypothetical protein [Flavobacterium cyanobacteriorum]
MKKIFLSALLVVVTSVFATNEKPKTELPKKDLTCCTATLSYKGKPVDSETVCSSFSF